LMINGLSSSARRLKVLYFIWYALRKEIHPSSL
jgi:hypothetical protein